MHFRQRWIGHGNWLAVCLMVASLTGCGGGGGGDSSPASPPAPVDAAPAFTTQPVSMTVTEGQAFTVTTAVIGTPTPTLQWQLSVGGVTWNDIPGATSATLSDAADLQDNGVLLRVVATNRAGSATSNVVTLTVTPLVADIAPTITTQPTSASVVAGQTFSFAAAASGTPTPTLQWQSSPDGTTWTNIAGATAATYSGTAVLADNGLQIRVVATNRANTANSNAVTLTVTSPVVDVQPTFATHPTSASVVSGQSFSFTVAASGSPTPTYQWQSSPDGITWTNIAGANSATYSRAAATQDNGHRFRAIATNRAGSVTSNVATLTVTAPPPAKYTISGTISGVTGTVVLQNNGGDNLTLTTNGPFTFATSIDNNTAYSVTVLTQPIGIGCTVANGSGTATANVTNVSVVCSKQLLGYAYTANYENRTISTFEVDAASGVLTKIGANTVVSGNANTALKNVVVHPTGQFLYVASGGTEEIATYTRDAASGALTLVNTAIAGTGIQEVLVDPTGRFLYVANYNAPSISRFVINQTTGELSNKLDLSLASVLAGPEDLAIDPTGRFLFATGGGNKLISATINATTGALTQVDSKDTGTNPEDVAIDPSGRFLYVANYQSDSVSVYSVTPDNGTLTKVGADVAAGNGAEAIAMDATGRFLYVANYDAASVTTFRRNLTTGVLTVIGTDVAAGSQPSDLVVDPTGRFIYVANKSSKDVTTFSIEPNLGTLTEVGSEVAVSLGFSSIAVTPPKRFAYASNTVANTISSFSVNSTTGALAVAGPVVNAPAAPWSMTFDATSQYAFAISSQSNQVRLFQIDSADGKLKTPTNNPVYTTGNDPRSVAVHPNGRWVYVSSIASDSTTGFVLDRAANVMTSMGNTVAGGQAIAIDPTGRFAFVGSWDTNSLYAYQINSNTGALSLIGTPISLASTGGGPYMIAVEPTGRYVYVLLNLEKKIAAFAINQTTGVIGEVSTRVTVGDDPRALTIDRTGRFLYVANYGSDTVNVIHLTRTTGAMSGYATLIAGDGPHSVRVDGSGRYLYVANELDSDIKIFKLSLDDGAPVSGSPANTPAGDGVRDVAVTGGSR